MLRKYLFILKSMFIRTIQYRAEISLWTALDVIPFILAFFVWDAIYKEGQIIGGLNLSQMIQYYLAILVVERLTSTHFEDWRSKEIREGKIDYFLTRPFSYLSEVLSKDVGAKAFSVLLFLPALAVILFLTKVTFQLEIPSLTPRTMFVFAVFIIAGYAVQFMLAFWVVLLNFWIERAEGFQHFKWITITLFSGFLIPISVMPLWLQRIVEFLPFKFLYAVPVGVIQNTLDISQNQVLYFISFIFAMVIATKFLWGRAKYRYTSAGG